MELSIVIVSYNARDELFDCLSSVERSPVRDRLEVVVVDNASSDGSVSMVRARFPGVAIIPLETNVGFSRANNLGWRRTTADAVVFLNPETVVPEPALTRLLTLLKVHPDVGAIGPLLRNADGSVQMSFGKMLTITAELGQKILNAGYRNGRGPLKRYVERRYERERDVDWVSGACLVTRREILERTGGFDEEFFLYSEDVDLCARIRAAGARVLFTPEVEVPHLKGRSMRKLGDDAFYESQRSRLYFYAKHYGQPRVGALKLYMAARLGLAYVFRPSERPACRKALRFVVGSAP